MTVIPGVNDLIYVREVDNLDFEKYRTPRIAPGYYNLETVRVAIQDALNDPTKSLPGDYVVTYNECLARFQFIYVAPSNLPQYYSELT